MRYFMRSRIEVAARHQNLFTVTWQERAIPGSAGCLRLFCGRGALSRKRPGLDRRCEKGRADPARGRSHLLMLAIDGMTGWAYFRYREQGARRPAEIRDMLLGGVAGAGLSGPDAAAGRAATASLRRLARRLFRRNGRGRRSLPRDERRPADPVTWVFDGAARGKPGSPHRRPQFS